MSFVYTLHLNVYGRGFYKEISSPVPLCKGMTIIVDLPGPTIYCVIEDVEVAVSDKAYSAAVDLIPKADTRSWENSTEEEIVVRLNKQGWRE